MKKLILCLLLILPSMLRAQDEGSGESMPALAKSLEAELKNARTAEGQGDKKAMAHAYGKLGGIYLNIARQSEESIKPFSNISPDRKVNLGRSMDYSEKSAEISDQIGDMDQLKSAYQNIYTAQKMQGKVKDAMSTYAKITALKHAILNPKKAKEIERRQVEYEAKKREDSIHREQLAAEQRLKEQTQKLSQQQQQLEATTKTLTAAEKEKENVSKALVQTQTDLSKEKTNSAETEKKLTQAEQEKALQAANLELQQSKLALQQNELKMKDEVLAQRKKEQIFYVFGFLAMLAITVLVFRSLRMQKKSNLALTKEKQRSEELLLNILPQEVAEELMEKGFADAKHFYNVTVLFTDFVSFTSVAESMSPQELVGELHVCFKAFDGILGKYHIEKIKTVGDAYMAVAGLPIPNENHAGDVVAAAIEIRDFMVKRKKEMGKGTFSIRIGINSGEVVAGIVGVRKFSYDIWGDTVNIAARMEQNSEEGKINISDSTYQLVKDKYACIYRGKVEAKNKGNIDMYYIS